MKEADITKQIRDLLKWHHIFHWKQWQGPMSQPKGVSDILGIYQGKMLAIEVKRPGYHCTPDQKRFLSRVEEQGGIAFVARSAEDVIKELELKVGPLF